MLVTESISETEFQKRSQDHPKSIMRYVRATQFVVMLPPIAASVLYYPADINFMNRINITEPNLQHFVAGCCFIAELALYEVKTANFGDILGKELYKLSYLLTPRLLFYYCKDNALTLLKHFIVALISLESSYVYSYLSWELLGNLFLSLCTFIAKFTTFHYSLIEMCNHFEKIGVDQNLHWAKKFGIFFSTLLIGVLGATYVYGKSEVAFEELTDNPELSIVAAGLSVVPTAFLTGTSLINLFKEFKSDTCKCPSVWRVMKEILYDWFALTAAAPNAYFLEDWGRTRVDPFMLWTLVIIVGITSLLTKRDALMKSAEVLSIQGASYYTSCKQRFFPKSAEQTALLQNDADTNGVVINATASIQV